MSAAERQIRKALMYSLCALAPLTGSCQAKFKDDPGGFSYLDRLRVLALQLEPAELAPGETATLSALVFEPAGRSLRYSWSWCPVRGNAEAGFACLISEEDLRMLWQSTGSATELPPYDLGSRETAEFTNLLSPDALADVCATILASEGVDERATRLCVDGLKPSVQLTVSTSKEEEVAIKEVPLLASGTAPSERNRNPTILPGLSTSESKTETEVGPDASLETGRTYNLIAGVTPEQAEIFLPAAEVGLPTPEPRRETLVLNWFTTQGFLHAGFADSSEIELGGPRTSFVDGSEFSSLVEAHWELPDYIEGTTAALYLVLQDERGGVAWRQYHYTLKGGE